MNDPNRNEMKQLDARRTLLPGLVLIACTLLWGCADLEDVAENPPVSEESPPDQVLFDSVVTDSKDGTRSWVLRSERMERWQDVDDAQLHGVLMDFYKADTLHSTLTSRRGRANLKTLDLFAWGDVVVVTRDGRRLETQELNYDDGTGLISNDVFNRFTHRRDVMTGIGMEATPDLGSFELKSEVKAEVVEAAEEDE